MSASAMQLLVFGRWKDRRGINPTIDSYKSRRGLLTSPGLTPPPLCRMIAVRANTSFGGGVMFQAALSLRHPVITARQGERGHQDKSAVQARGVDAPALRHVDGARCMRTWLSMYRLSPIFPPLIPVYQTHADGSRSPPRGVVAVISESRSLRKTESSIFRGLNAGLLYTRCPLFAPSGRSRPEDV